jgi:hypothetical protein
MKAEEFRKSEEGKGIFAARKTVLEGLFGEAKRCHGLRRAKQRGVEKVEIQALLTAAALNIKRLLKGLENATGGAKSRLASGLSNLAGSLLGTLSRSNRRLALAEGRF